MPLTQSSRLRPSFLLMALACAWSFSAYSQTMGISATSKKVRVQWVANVSAYPEEQDDQFLFRLAGVMGEFTKKTKFEACAQICRASDNRLGVSVYTTRAHIGCFVVNVCPSEMTETGETIHSHPDDKKFTYNQVDRLFLPPPLLRKNPAAPKGSPAAAVFSQTDYDNGPGYVVARGVLWHQEGRGTDRRVGILKKGGSEHIYFAEH